MLFVKYFYVCHDRPSSRGGEMSITSMALTAVDACYNGSEVSGGKEKVEAGR